MKYPVLNPNFESHVSLDLNESLVDSTYVGLGLVFVSIQPLCVIRTFTSKQLLKFTFKAIIDNYLLSAILLIALVVFSEFFLFFSPSLLSYL